MRLEGFEEVSAVLKPGVYALVLRGVVIYVGKSRALYQRIYAHRTTAARAKRGQSIPSWLPIKGFVFDEVWVRPCRLEDLDALEADMVQRYRPRYNQSLKDAAARAPTVTITPLGVPIILRGSLPGPSQTQALRRL